ncbi:MAG: protein translocase subunit SecF [Treponema sp.]|jgi:preprotein translocase subunit SecF|nr:protein translocase subunit SecF [Treponema sp.]
MKKVIQFSRFFLPAAVISGIVFVTGISGFIVKGFNLGVDFQAGLIQEVQFAPTAFSLRWQGTSNAILSFDRGSLYIVVSGAGIENRTYAFSFSEYNNLGSLTQAMMRQVEGLDVTMTAGESINPQWLLFSAQGNPYLSETPYVVHYLPPQSTAIDIAEVRSAMADLGQGVSVQNLGLPQDRHFMVRVEDKEEGRVKPDEITTVLEAHFGKGGVAVLRSDYVGSRFSKDLTDQAGILTALTLLLILIYATIRFKPQYAIGAVIAIIHDGIVVIAFVVWSRIEFNTSTIAAILTILGYSINNTIVVFDRIRENLRIYPDSAFVDVVNRSLTGVLSRTIITTLTTMLAVLSLFIFTTGSMKDFALALMVGMLSGVYTTLFIASGFVYLWDNRKQERDKRKQTQSLVKVR